MTLPMTTAEGRLGRDPELRFTSTGTAVASFSIACQERVKDASGQWTDGDTTWLDVTVWRGLAEAVADELRRGDLVAVTGRLKVREYETRDGGKGRAVEVTADTVAKVITARRSGEWSDAQRTTRPAQARTSQGSRPDPWGVGAGGDEPPF